MMVLSKEPPQINFSQSYETELNVVWEGKQQDPIIWSKEDDKLYRNNEKRNEKIAKITNNFISETKGRKHHYGISEPYLWKSKEHREQCFEILQAAGLLKQEQEQQGTLYDSRGYYNTSTRRLPIEAKRLPSDQELWIDELRKFSELGGMEVVL
jgi:squalene cyclase